MDFYFEELRDEKEEFAKYFKHLNFLGSGSFGTVVHAIHLGLKQEVAVKIVQKKKSNTSKITQMMQEGMILKDLHHKNIVELIDLIEGDQNIYIVLEYMPYGTLKNLIEERKKNEAYFSEYEISLLMKNLFEAVNYLHSLEIVHRDLKPENILVRDKNNLNSIKIADFGLSSLYFEENDYYEKSGTLIFMAPEQILKKYHSKNVDMWSCGIIFFMLLSQGIHPLHDKKDTRESYINKLQNSEWKFDFKLSVMAKDLFMKLVKNSPFHRYTSSEALKHPFITRNTEDEIPRTLLDKINVKFSRNRLKEIVGISMFLSYFKQGNQIPPNYEKLVNIISQRKKEYSLKTQTNGLVSDYEDESEDEIYSVKELELYNVKSQENDFIDLIKKDSKNEFDLYFHMIKKKSIMKSGNVSPNKRKTTKKENKKIEFFNTLNIKEKTRVVIKSAVDLPFLNINTENLPVVQRSKTKSKTFIHKSGLGLNDKFKDFILPPILSSGSKSFKDKSNIRKTTSKSVHK